MDSFGFGCRMYSLNMWCIHTVPEIPYLMNVWRCMSQVHQCTCYMQVHLPCWNHAGRPVVVDKPWTFSRARNLCNPKKQKIWKSIRCWSQTSGNCTSWMSWISLLLKQKVLGLAPSWHFKRVTDPSDPGLESAIIRAHCKTWSEFPFQNIGKEPLHKLFDHSTVDGSEIPKNHLGWKEACK